MHYIAEMLSNDDGPIVMVRAGSSDEAFALASDEAADHDMAVTDDEADILIGWVRATPCRKGGHETREGLEWCDGGMRCHYAYGEPGPGAFRGAFVNVRYLDRDADPVAMARESLARHRKVIDTDGISAIR